MITTCTKCGTLYEAGSEEQAYEPERFCFGCREAQKKETIEHEEQQAADMERRLGI